MSKKITRTMEVLKLSKEGNVVYRSANGTDALELAEYLKEGYELNKINAQLSMDEDDFIESADVKEVE